MLHWRLIGICSDREDTTDDAAFDRQFQNDTFLAPAHTRDTAGHLTGTGWSTLLRVIYLTGVSLKITLFKKGETPLHFQDQTDHQLRLCISLRAVGMAIAEDDLLS